jgi:four helix bundle protein
VFAAAVVDLVESLPRGRAADVIGTQLLRAGTSVGANYRAACRARSRREFIAKMGIVEEEADECQFWLDLLLARGLGDADRISSLCNGANTIVAMVIASIRTARRTPRATPHSALRTPHLSAGASDVH